MPVVCPRRREGHQGTKHYHIISSNTIAHINAVPMVCPRGREGHQGVFRNTSSSTVILYQQHFVDSNKKLVLLGTFGGDYYCPTSVTGRRLNTTLSSLPYQVSLMDRDVGDRKDEALGEVFVPMAAFKEPKVPSYTQRPPVFLYLRYSPCFPWMPGSCWWFLTCSKQQWQYLFIYLCPINSTI